MPSAEEHLRSDTGAMLASSLFQIALLKAEVDRLKAELDASRAVAAANDHVPR
jgi:uncharacterized small protein (DUF1192 family)